MFPLVIFKGIALITSRWGPGLVVPVTWAPVEWSRDSYTEHGLERDWNDYS